MRTNFGRQKVIVLTRVNGYYYVNLYNNSTKNPGRCSFGYDEFIELIGMSHILEQLKPQFDEVSFLFIVIAKSNIYDVESISFEFTKQILLNTKLVFFFLFYNGRIPIINNMINSNKINNNNKISNKCLHHHTLPNILKCWVSTKDKAI